MRLVGDWLIPGEGRGVTIRNGAIDIGADGRIVAVGSESELGEADAEVHRIGGLLMPGLVNAHAHGPMSLLRSAGDGLPLQQWLTDAVWPLEGAMTPDDVVVAMELAFCEMLLAGVTTSTEMYLHEASVAQAAANVGARCQIMAGLISFLMPDDDATAARLDAIARFAADTEATTRHVTVGYGAHSVYDLGRERLAALARHVAPSRSMVHIHLEETQAERQQVLDELGHSATEVLADVGLLDAGPVVAAHGVWLSDSDMRLLADAGASVVHCPQSNLKLGSGIARVPAMLDADLRVGLGTDGAASNDNLNLWEDMRLAALLARGASHDPTALSAVQGLGLATSGGADAIGMTDVGRLAPGCWADVIRLDLDHPAFLPAVDEDLFAHVVWAGNAHHVTDVWVAGQLKVRGGELHGALADFDQLRAKVNEAAHRIRGLTTGK